MTAYPATEKQFTFIKKLLAERTLNEHEEQFIDSARKDAMAGLLDRKAASGIIEWLMGLPKTPAKPGRNCADADQVPVGMHVYGDDIYRVKASRSSGRHYAEQLVQVDETSWKFQYARGVVYRLSRATVMSAEAASQFGATYGICCNCGRTLTHPSSVHHGYGPVCAENNGWAWGDIPAVPQPVHVSVDPAAELGSPSYVPDYDGPEDANRAAEAQAEAEEAFSYSRYADQVQANRTRQDRADQAEVDDMLALVDQAGL